MKSNWLQIIIKIYKIWSAVLFVVFLVVVDYRYCIFYLWQQSTALMILPLLVDLIILFHKKHKLLKIDQELESLKQQAESGKDSLL
ncbi:MAG: hypothetical protein PHN80_08055 [Hespellia sp.]|nr:hypothetical protein [Hespellia sp.]